MDDWTEHFEGLHGIDPDLQARLVAGGKPVEAPEGTVVFTPGSAAQNLLLLLEGVVRVQQISEEGHEIVLYRVTDGETCVMTLSCLLSHEDYSAEGVAETPVRAISIPAELFEDCMAESSRFRAFVFSSYSHRITELFSVINEVAFDRIDARLARSLLELTDKDGHLNATHQRLAMELGTAREVISRQVNEFRRRGWISATRGEIYILDSNALGQLAARR